MIIFHSALAGLMARDNNTPDRGKPANCARDSRHATKATTTIERAALLNFRGENHNRELEQSPQISHHRNPPAFVTAQNAVSGQARSLLCILARFLTLLNIVTTTAHAFSAATGSPHISNFPRKQTWVAPKALPELMNDMYQVHGATESAGDIGVFGAIDGGSTAIKPALDLLLMEEETADVAVPEEMHGPVSVEARLTWNLKIHGTYLCHSF